MGVKLKLLRTDAPAHAVRAYLWEAAELWVALGPFLGERYGEAAATLERIVAGRDTDASVKAESARSAATAAGARLVDATAWAAEAVQLVRRHGGFVAGELRRGGEAALARMVELACATGGRANLQRHGDVRRALLTQAAGLPRVASALGRWPPPVALEARVGEALARLDAATVEEVRLDLVARMAEAAFVIAMRAAAEDVNRLVRVVRAFEAAAPANLVGALERLPRSHPEVFRGGGGGRKRRGGGGGDGGETHDPER